MNRPTHHYWGGTFPCRFSRPMTRDEQEAWNRTAAGAHEELVRAVTRLKGTIRTALLAFRTPG